MQHAGTAINREVIRTRLVRTDAPLPDLGARILAFARAAAAMHMAQSAHGRAGAGANQLDAGRMTPRHGGTI